MAEVERDKTTNLKLIKPKEEEFYNIQDFNSNFDKIDEAVGNNTSQLKDCAKNISQLSNSNLLINGYFINSVNQRNMKTYEWKNGGLYTLDRWHLAYGGNITLNDEGVIFDTQSSPNVSCELRQVIENSKYYIRGKDVTLSLKYKVSYVYSGETCGQLAFYSRLTGSSSRVENLNFDGQWHTITFTAKEDLLSNDDGTKESIFIIRAKNIKIELEWAKLEIGSIATPFIPRLYGEKLALCQRYCYKTPYQKVIRASYITADLIGFDISLPVDMRVSPTLLGNANSDYFISSFNGGTHLDGFSFSVVKTGSGIAIIANKKSHGLNDANFVITPTSGLDAEIY
ncbi:UNVERIFIED_ORG: hypothetical protein B2H93_16000 [Clostridium botulinum]